VPLRPPEHQLETESRTAFQAAIPRAWVFTVPSADYGLDGLVEIFEEDGRHTGEQFFVQLKARSEPRLDRALALRFSHDMADYYARQALPVLIVGYHAPDKRLYARWFHTFDPHYGGHGSAGLTFRLTEQDAWTDETAARILTEVRAFRRWRSARLALPVSFSLEVDGDSVHGISRRSLEMALSRLAEPASDILEIHRDYRPNDPTISISSDGIVVDFNGVTSMTTHHTEYSGDGLVERLARDVFVTVALGFAQLGDHNTAARLMRRFAATAPLLDHPDVLFRSTGFFVQSHRVLDALRLGEDIRQHHENGSALADLMFTATLAQAPAMTADEIEDVRFYLIEAARQADEDGLADDARLAHYRLGNWLRANERWEEALHHYTRAAEWDPTYIDRPYFPNELAGVHFMLGHYGKAVDLYTAALEGGEDVQALLADAYMHAGKYRMTVEVLNEYMRSRDQTTPRWALLAWALPQAMATLGIEEQQRDQEGARLSGDGSDGGAVEDGAMAALRRDLLTAIAWFNLGVFWHKEGKGNPALLAFVMAGLLEQRDTEAWCNATLIAIATEEQGLFVAVAEAAFDIHGVAFLEALAAFLDRQKEGFPSDEVMTAVEETVRNVVREQPGFDLRLLRDDGSYETISFPRPPRRSPIQ
jgi:tetratricopeptide (TPR) repeat protein